VAFITDLYPKLSLTFIELEVSRLRDLGMPIDLYAIWRPSPGAPLSGRTQSLTQSTTYLSSAPIKHLMRAHYVYARRAPARYVAALRHVLRPHPTTRRRLRTLYGFVIAPQLAASLEQRRIGHIHAHFAGGACTVAMMASELAGLTFSFTAHGSDVLVEKVLLTEKTTRAKFAVAVCEHIRQVLLASAPKAIPGKIKTIRMGVDPGAFLRGTGRGSGDPIVFTAIGNLVWQKGHEYLIEACRILKARGVDFRCVIVGDGPRRNRLSRLIRSCNVQSEVSLVGSVEHDEIGKYYRQSDVLIHPSVSEGIPVVLMEAMAAGLPVIASDITGIPELVDDGRNGLLVQARDPEQLAAAAMRLIEDEDLRSRLGRSARRTILNEFHVDSRTAEVARLFGSELAL